MSAQRVRVDKWLWSVRVYRTRTAASDACSTGKVTVNDEPAKPATKVGVGDVVVAQRGRRSLVYAVVEPIEKRVSATLAADCFDDRTPEEPATSRQPAPPGGARLRGEGRPTKRDRRRLDRLRGR